MENGGLMQIKIGVISVMVGNFNSLAHIVTVVLRSGKENISLCYRFSVSTDALPSSWFLPRLNKNPFSFFGNTIDQ